VNLDLIASVLCGWLALCAFGLHVVSSPKRHNWMTLPEYVRRGFLVTGAMFTWRSVNFITNGSQDLGHINTEGMMALIAVTYTVTAVAFWVAQRTLPAKVWDRLRWVEHVEREDPGKVPVMMDEAEVVDAARILGFKAAAPGEPPDALHKEPVIKVRVRG
jgi:hypothetical protein